jgi:hypothetical protein
LRPTISRPVRLGIGLPFGAHDQILSSFPFDKYFVVLPRPPSLMRGRVCNLQCNRCLVRSLRTNNHTLPSHLRLCSLFVASSDSQVLRWRYSNPPPHRLHFVSNCHGPFYVGNVLLHYADLQKTRSVCYMLLSGAWQ